MIYLESPEKNPYFNLALEEYVFEKLDPTQDYFILWQNENAIIVGKYQNTAEEINAAAVAEQGIRVVRRLSGGGAVYHDTGNLNFTFIVGEEKNPLFDFNCFVLPIIDALERLGVHATFNGRNDLTIDGKKFSGNSQYCKKGRILHHGCIMLDSNMKMVADVLRVKEAKFVSKSAKSVRSRVTTINNHAVQPISMGQFKDMLVLCVDERNHLEHGILTETDLENIRCIQQEKYETWEWNYGASPAFEMRREIKFPCGLITAHMQVSGGYIQEIRFFGDFFGNGELSDFEQSLKGIALDEKLEETLKTKNVGYYINGLSAAELCTLIQ